MGNQDAELRRRRDATARARNNVRETRDRQHDNGSASRSDYATARRDLRDAEAAQARAQRALDKSKGR